MNFETPRQRRGNRVDSIDWHLDLRIDPDGDWRTYVPPPQWREPLLLPDDWDA